MTIMPDYAEGAGSLYFVVTYSNLTFFPQPGEAVEST